LEIMLLSDEYGTELLLRNTEERRLRDLERRRIANERRAQTQAANGGARPTIRGRLAALAGGDTVRMPVARPSGTVGVPQPQQVHVGLR
jgi:hypothetical protein